MELTKFKKYKSQFMPNSFLGEKIIVTGGGSGIGRCIAHELASLGAEVVILGRNQEKLIHVSNEIKEDGGKVSWYSLDIRDEERIKTVIKEIVTLGPIMGLVNNAGGQFVSPLENISSNGFDAVVKTNLMGGFLMAREVFLQSMRQNGGSIVNITAESSKGMPGMGHSGASRAGMENLTKTAAYEWAYCGVRVNSVAPGIIESSGLQKYPESVQSMLPTYKAQIPMQRLGTESEVSSIVVFLLSSAAAYISGAHIAVDGGLSLGQSLMPKLKPKKTFVYQGMHRQ